MSSESFDCLDRCEFSRVGILFSDDSGTCTDSGKGDVGSGFCEANAPLPKLSRVGVVASSIGRGVWLGAVLGLGVIGDAIVSSFGVESASANGELTGRKAAAMMDAY